MVKDLQVAEADITGELATGKLISPMITSTVVEGTPLVQLVAVAQLVLVVPFQLVWENITVLHNSNTPIRSRSFR